MSVERIKEYSETPTEAAAIIRSSRPSSDWPSSGKVEFENYSTRYREDLDLVLKDVNVVIGEGAKVSLFTYLSLSRFHSTTMSITSPCLLYVH